MARRSTNFSLAVKTEGGLLPTDFLLDLAALSKEIEGLKPEQYHLSDREKINEAINQAYSRLQGFWLGFKDTFEKLPLDDYATSATKEKWLLPLFDCLGYGRLIAAEAVTVGDRQYKTSHMRENVAIHLVGFRVDLDKRSTAGGARGSSPHSLVQELLNQSDNHLWAFVSNGRKLRVLRDNVSLTRQAYIEFDIENIFEGDGYADFRLLWLLCHQSRVEGMPPEGCWLEKWKDAAQRSGIRVRDQLRIGVEKALESFGTGFLRHRANEELRARIRNGEITAEEYYRQLLRLIYRLLFLFVTEDKNVLLRPDATTQQRKVYYDYYSTTRLREIAGKRRGTMHEDLWANLSFVFEQLSSESGCAELALPALGSFLWSNGATPLFERARIYNTDLLDGLRNLCFSIEAGVRRSVQYGHLESEELGSIYESLLDQIPNIDFTSQLPTFGLHQAAGSERKTTGSYYTPTSLVNCLLDSALEPVLNRATKEPKPEEAILNLRLCDPACGSGHFLIAAAHRIAKRLASVRSGDSEPGPEHTGKALRDVISRCIYGVDVNEMAVELCKVSLWLQSATPGVPLSFLDHKIKCGNSLLGTTPALIDKGIPDAAFDAIEGDEKETVKQVRAANKKQTNLHAIAGFLKYDGASLDELSSKLATIDQAPDKSVAEVHTKENEYAALLRSDSYLHAQYICDSWCASFVWVMAPGAPSPITREVFGRIRSDYRNIDQAVRKEIIRLRKQYNFFHWHLEFPHIFLKPEVSGNRASTTGWSGGFDVVLGNPPWERVKLQEQEWFASRLPELATARTAAIRSRMIGDLKITNPTLYRAFTEDRRKAEGESHIVRNSGRFPLCGRGDVNTYSVFAETIRDVLAESGYAGFIVPSGIATDDTTKFFFADLVEKKSLVSLFDFENRKAIFPGVHRSYKFSLVTLAGPSAASSHTGTDFVFFALDTADLLEQDKHFKLSASELTLLNPNTRTCAVFRSKLDAELTKKIYSQVPILVKEGPPIENPWGIKLARQFDMSNDSGLFRTKLALEQASFKLNGNIFEKSTGSGIERYLPLYEAKMLHQFDHRWATYDYSRLNSKDEPETREVTLEEKKNRNFTVLPRHWVAETEVIEKCESKWNQGWLLGYRRVARTTDERTVIATIFPLSAAGDSIFLVYPKINSAEICLSLLACLNSLVLDYVARQKIGGMNLSFFLMEQFPILTPQMMQAESTWEPRKSNCKWLAERVSELLGLPNTMLESFTEHSWNHDLQRRIELQAEINAACFHLYGLDRNEVEHILTTFPILAEKEIKQFGQFKSRQLILEAYELLKISPAYAEVEQ